MSRIRHAPSGWAGEQPRSARRRWAIPWCGARARIRSQNGSCASWRPAQGRPPWQHAWRTARPATNQNPSTLGPSQSAARRRTQYPGAPQGSHTPCCCMSDAQSQHVAHTAAVAGERAAEGDPRRGGGGGGGGCNQDYAVAVAATASGARAGWLSTAAALRAAGFGFAILRIGRALDTAAFFAATAGSEPATVVSHGCLSSLLSKRVLSWPLGPSPLPTSSPAPGPLGWTRKRQQIRHEASQPPSCARTSPDSLPRRRAPATAAPGDDFAAADIFLALLFVNAGARLDPLGRGLP